MTCDTESAVGFVIFVSDGSIKGGKNGLNGPFFVYILYDQPFYEFGIEIEE
ncbi:MAG TPA: hypothetical protein PLK90_03080 [Clostridiales bacterium]|nr:hypothetical protein [Clostridiales bacterium]HQP69363.1 hypothetical protein [Clostridiales bacterium]